MAAEKASLVMVHLAEGAKKAYTSAWNRWTLFCRLRDHGPWLEFESKRELRLQEEKVLDFVVHMSSTMTRAAGTIATHLYAIRKEHEVQGMGNPLERMSRVWPAMGAP